MTMNIKLYDYYAFDNPLKPVFYADCILKLYENPY